MGVAIFCHIIMQSVTCNHIHLATFAIFYLLEASAGVIHTQGEGIHNGVNTRGWALWGLP